MKNLLSLIILYLAVATMIYAQKVPTSSTKLSHARAVIKLDVTPTNFLFKTLALSYEHALETNWSVVMKGSATYFSTTIWDEFEGTIQGYAIMPEVRYYISDYAPQGIYVSAFGKYSDHRFDVSDPSVKSSNLTLFRQTGFQVGANLGWQFGIGRKRKGIPFLTLDMQYGGGYKFHSIATKFATTGRLLNLKSKGFTPNFDFAIGIPII
jgi:hypothetical protein